ALDLIGGRLHLRIVGGEGESGCEQREREREYQEQSEWFHRSSFSDRGAGGGPIDASLVMIDPLAHWTLASPRRARASPPGTRSTPRAVAPRANRRARPSCVESRP